MTPDGDPVRVEVDQEEKAHAEARRTQRRIGMMKQQHASANSALRENDITGVVIDTALDVHRRLGPGLFESVYAAVLAYELRKRGLYVETEVAIPVEWETVRLEVGFRADLIVEHLVLIELKSVEAVAPVHKKQLLTYLRLTDQRVGLLINFGMELLKDGIHRVVNNFQEGPHAEAQRPRRRLSDGDASQ
jgi:GxxExxY protein